jgi:hypothetical protein
MRVYIALELRAYYAFCKKFPVSTSYTADRIAVHEELAREYFDEFDEKISAAPKQS